MKYKLVDNNSLPIHIGGNNNLLYLFTGHGEPLVANKDKATMSHLHYSSEIEKNKIKSDELDAYKLFQIPSNIEIIFFNKLGQAHESCPCDFENVIIDATYEDIIKSFNKYVSFIDNKEQAEISDDNESLLGDIIYIRYPSNILCADIELDTKDMILDENMIGLKQYYEKYQKIGLYKYPLNKDDLFINNCRPDKKYGLTEEYIYLTDAYYAHFFEKYDSNGNPLTDNKIPLNINFHEYIKTNINNKYSGYYKLDEVIEKIIDMYLDGMTIDNEVFNAYKTHIVKREEHELNKQKSSQGSIDINNICDTKGKTKLSDICNYLSASEQVNSSYDKIILLVITCRGDADME